MSLWYKRLTVNQITRLGRMFSRAVEKVVPEELRPYLAVENTSTRHAFHFRADIDFSRHGMRHQHVLMRADTKADTLDLYREYISPIVMDDEGNLNPKIHTVLQEELSLRIVKIHDEWRLNRPLLDHWVGKVDVSREYDSPLIRVNLGDLTEQDYERLLECLPKVFKRPEWPTKPEVRGKNTRYDRKEPV